MITKEASLLKTFEKPWEDARFEGILISPDEEKILVEGAGRLKIWNRELTEILFETANDPGSGEFNATWREDSEVVWYMGGAEDIKIDLVNGQRGQECTASADIIPI